MSIFVCRSLNTKMKRSLHMCIYLGTKADHTIKSEEHIFPACLGGIRKLDNNAVSAEANRTFVQLENEFAHSSSIGMARDFWGPGKRGKNKLPESNVIYYLNKQKQSYELGYLFQGTLHSIPQIHINRKSDTFCFNCEKEEGVEGNEVFKLFTYEIERHLSKTDRFIYIAIDDVKMCDDYIIAIHQNKLFIASGVDRSKIDTVWIFSRLKILKDADFLNIEFGVVENPTIHRTICESENTHRVYAKIAFNSLCYLKGTDFVNCSEFDDFREWIITGEGHSEQWLDEEICSPDELTEYFPDKSHWCLFTLVDGTVCAIVCLYGYFSRKFRIGKLPTDMKMRLDGYICDYVNQKEMTLDEYIKSCRIR